MDELIVQLVPLLVLGGIAAALFVMAVMTVGQVFGYGCRRGAESCAAFVWVRLRRRR